MALPSGTVTFLFTDLESSTRLWEEHPDAMQGALARHDEILRHEIAANRGIVVKNTGDGLHVVFATASDAIAAAIDAQRALSAEPWGDTGPLLVRIGVHSGGAEVRDDDYFGPTLNRAARITAAAHGGQIVVSHASEVLTRTICRRAYFSATSVSTGCATCHVRSASSRWSSPRSDPSFRRCAHSPHRAATCRRSSPRSSIVLPTSRRSSRHSPDRVS